VQCKVQNQTKVHMIHTIQNSQNKSTNYSRCHHPHQCTLNPFTNTPAIKFHKHQKHFKSKKQKKKQFFSFKSSQTNKNKNYLLVLVSFIIEHCKRNNEEHKNSIDNINRKPQILHREREITRAIINSMPASLPIRHIRRKHQYRNRRNR